MNNPESQFMSPMSRPPAQKKQRGGATPAGARGPPPSSSGASGRRITAAAADGIARRKAELRRLQEQRKQVSVARVASAAAGPPPTAAASTTAAAPPQMKPAGVGRHYSDLFPTVPKSPSPMVQRETLLEVSGGAPVPGLDQPNLPKEMPTFDGPPISSGPPIGAGPPLASSTGPPPTTTAPGIKSNPPTPAVNRKLEFPSSTAASRAKSAPRSRPPPPPPPKAAYEAPPATSARPGSLKPRARPTPVSPTALKAAATIEKKAVPKTPHMIPSSRLHGVSGLQDTTPEPDVPKKMPAAGTPHPSKMPPTSTPHPSKIESPNQKSSSKRDKLNAMRDAAAAVDEPPTPARKPAPSPPEKMTEPAEPSSFVTSATAKRLEETLQKTEHEKTAALIKIKELEDKLLQANEKIAEKDAPALPAPGAANLDLEYLFTLSETDGPVAALEWARHQAEELKNAPPSTPAKLVNFANSPMAGLETPMRRRISSRTVTPHPKRFNGPADAEQVERQNLKHYNEAVDCVDHEYTGKFATFYIRRPFGRPSAPELFNYCSPMPNEEYAKRAHISNMAALEVGVNIHPDNSVLLLFGVAGVRYKINARQDQEWTTIQNVDDLEEPLGHVSYIDEQANELEYSLDEVLEEALMLREQYVNTVTEMARTLKERPSQAAGGAPPAIQRAPSRDAAVETDEKGMATDVPKTIDTSGDKAKAAPPPEDTHSGSSDVLTVFFSWIITSILGLVYFVVIGLPLKIVQTVFIMTVAYCIFNMLYFYLAQDYNSWVIQESGGSVTMSELVNFANTRLGVM